MNMETICLLAVLCISIIFLIVLVIVAMLIYFQLKIKMSLEEKKIIYNFDFKKDYFEILDIMITESLTHYQVTKLGFKQDLYINEGQQKKMIEYILRDVLGKLSPVYYNLLIMVYNDNRLEDIIFEKISMAVMAYVQTTNSTLA